MYTKTLLTIAAALVLFAFMAGCAGTSTKRSAGTYMDDKWISTKVNSKLWSDPITSARNIDVTSYDGVVQLSGFVSTEDELKRAGQIARDTKGVRAVKNDLILRSSVKPPETAPK